MRTCRFPIDSRVGDCGFYIDEHIDHTEAGWICPGQEIEDEK